MIGFNRLLMQDRRTEGFCPLTLCCTVSLHLSPGRTEDQGRDVRVRFFLQKIQCKRETPRHRIY